MLHRTLKTHKSLHILLQIQAQHNFVSALVACLWFFSYIFKLAHVSLLSIGNLRGIHRTNCNTKLQLKIEFCVETMKNTQHNTATQDFGRFSSLTFSFSIFVLFRPLCCGISFFGLVATQKCLFPQLKMDILCCKEPILPFYSVLRGVQHKLLQHKHTNSS